MIRLLTPLAALAAATFAPAVQAASNPDPIVVDRTDDYVSVRVGSADLDLVTPGGQHEMRGRVQSAASQVCQKAVPRGYFRNLKPFALGHCIADTREAAEPQLTAVFARAARGEKVAGLNFKLARPAR